MNENELKQIWQNAEVKDTLVIDFKQLQKGINNWQRKLRRRIEVDFLAGVLLLIIYVSLSIFYTHGLYVLPIILLVFIWYYYKLWSMYRNKLALEEVTNTKEYLAKKGKELKTFIRRNRVFALVFALPFTLFAFVVSTTFNQTANEYFSFEYLSKNPDLIYISLIFCVVISVICIIVVEILLRISYLPPLDKIEELLKELESE